MDADRGRHRRCQVEQQTDMSEPTGSGVLTEERVDRWCVTLEASSVNRDWGYREGETVDGKAKWQWQGQVQGCSSPYVRELNGIDFET